MPPAYHGREERDEATLGRKRVAFVCCNGRLDGAYDHALPEYHDGRRASGPYQPQSSSVP